MYALRTYAPSTNHAEFHGLLMLCYSLKFTQCLLYIFWQIVFLAHNWRSDLCIRVPEKSISSRVRRPVSFPHNPSFSLPDKGSWLLLQTKRKMEDKH